MYNLTIFTYKFMSQIQIIFNYLNMCENFKEKKPNDKSKFISRLVATFGMFFKRQNKYREQRLLKINQKFPTTAKKMKALLPFMITPYKFLLEYMGKTKEKVKISA